MAFVVGFIVYDGEKLSTACWLASKVSFGFLSFGLIWFVVHNNIVQRAKELQRISQLAEEAAAEADDISEENPEQIDEIMEVESDEIVEIVDAEPEKADAIVEVSNWPYLKLRITINTSKGTTRIHVLKLEKKTRSFSDANLIKQCLDEYKRRMIVFGKWKAKNKKTEWIKIVHTNSPCI